MANETASGGAAPGTGNGTKSTAEMEQDIDQATDSILGKYGIKVPKKSEAAAGAETPEAKAAREAKEAEAAAGEETPEAKAAREALEAEAAAGEETPEAKAAREALEAEAAETARAVETKLKDLPAEHRKLAQTLISERVGKVIAVERGKREAAESKVTAAEERVTALNGELEELRKSKGAAPVNVPGMHPLFLARTAADIDNYEAEVEETLLWAEENRDGYEAKTAQEKSYTADEIKARVRELRLERIRVIPQARRLLTDREAADVPLKKTMPALFQAGTEEYRAAQALRKQLPELDRLPNANELVAQIILGTKQLKVLANPPARTTTVTQPIKKAPRAPGGGGPARGAATEPVAGSSASDAVKRVMANPGDKSAFRAAIAANT